ncbi:spermatogenesis-associated protein 3 [Orycteropus afer afer]|uniref:Spermatogenesis-associated protein 3 n=1 Tax=Orycteropus afer afer TaxID=1230840 RepID=A0A8B7A263_ORYAF|nr:spermatogenesis-associated protein 3 [Orycteropus afer afer]
MRKGKRKKSDARRRNSASQNPSSESSPPHPSSDSAPQLPSSDSTPPHPGSDTNLQPPSSESNPQNSVPQALPAPEISTPTQCLLPVDNGSKSLLPSERPGPLTHVGPHFCSCARCPGSSACWRRLGQCHSRISDALMPRDWHPLPGRETPSLLTFYRKSGRKHSVHRNLRTPSSRDRCCGPGSPGSCLLHH